MRAPSSLLRPAAVLRRLGVRLALLAVLAGALMPGFSRLLQPAAVLDLATLCLTGPDDAGTSREPAHAPDDACAYCTLAHAAPLLAPGAAAPVAQLAYAPPVPPAQERVREGTAQARAASARAPPARA